MFRIKINDKFWNFEDSKITSSEDEKILIKSSLEAKNIAEFLKEVLPEKTVKLEIIDDNSI